MATTPEGKVKAGIRRLLESKGIVRAGSSNVNDAIAGWYYMPLQGALSTHGIPDFVCCIGGRFVAIEAKAPGRRADTTEHQKRRISEIRFAGGVALVVDDVEILEEFFDEQCERA